MTHRLDPVRKLEPSRHEDTWPWLAFMLLLLILAILVAIMSPSHLAAPGNAAVPSMNFLAENPELSSFARWQAVGRAEARPALLQHNPELRSFESYQQDRLTKQAELLAENPELGTFQRQQTH